MKSQRLSQSIFSVYLLLLFGFLFCPLLFMAISAFNTNSYPTAYPVDGLTLSWFRAIVDDPDVMSGLKTSILISILVVALAVPIGLSAAVIFQYLGKRARSFFYVLMVSPILTPGIIIGIATVIFWKNVTHATGTTEALYNGILVTLFGQVSFIASYCMLIISARLQQFDAAEEEAARDLGASFGQILRGVLLPFLRPAILTSSVLGFLFSFENYNTTTFTILSDKTLVTVLAGKVRGGSTPQLSALAVVIIGITLAAAIGYELAKRHEERRRSAAIT